MDFRLGRKLIATKRGKLLSRRNLLPNEFVYRHLVFVLNLTLKLLSWPLRIRLRQCPTPVGTF
jgi:hypothetical protein